MDHENVSGSSGSDLDTEDDRNSRESTSANREKSTTTTRPSMRGLQIAIAEGWLVQTGAGICAVSRTTDIVKPPKAEALSLPSDLIAKMSFRVRLSDKLFFSYLPTWNTSLDRLNDASSGPLLTSIKSQSAPSGMSLSTLPALFLPENRCLPLLHEHNKRGELVSSPH